MRILIAHNFYQQVGGEDSVFHCEKQALLERGHQVDTFEVSNSELRNVPPWRAFFLSLWNFKAQRALSDKLKTFSPDVVHFHNIFPYMSLAPLRVCYKNKIPVVMTLHNYRALCLNALLFRNGKVCTDCVGKIPFLGVLRKCYRNDFVESMGAFFIHLLVYKSGLLFRWVDRFIVLSHFAKELMVSSGFPMKKVVVKGNFNSLPTLSKADFSHRQKTVLFVGRFSPEKGVDVLLEAWSQMKDKKGFELQLIGDGPELTALQSEFSKLHGVRWLGSLGREQVFSRMQQSFVLVFPSKWFEGYPMTLAEATAAYVPLLVARIGALPTLVCDAEATPEEGNALLFEAGSSKDLGKKLLRLMDNFDLAEKMSKYSAHINEQRNSKELNMVVLETLYSNVIAEVKKN